MTQNGQTERPATVELSAEELDEINGGTPSLYGMLVAQYILWHWSGTIYKGPLN